MLPQTVIFGFLDKPNNQNLVLLNHLLFLFKLNVYNSRNKKQDSLGKKTSRKKWIMTDQK